VKIAIAGPGRSGTSFLAKLLGAWGLYVPPENGNWQNEAQAGLESRIGFGSKYEVDKDPWLFEYISRLEKNQLDQYDAFIIPIRSQADAVISRTIQERYFRTLNGEGDHWLWNSWGTTPGGSVSDASVAGVSKTLEAGLWVVLEKLASEGIQPIILNFPRIVIDFDYLWENVGPILYSRISESDARASFKIIADSSKVRVESLSEKFPGIHRAELTGIIEMQRGRIQKLEQQLLATQTTGMEELSRLESEFESVTRERDSLLTERDSLVASKSWRMTKPFRYIRYLWSLLGPPR